eukprot:scaffold241613_cov39-Tisochrysis_lutea.AAC.2
MMVARRTRTRHHFRGDSAVPRGMSSLLHAPAGHPPQKKLRAKVVRQRCLVLDDTNVALAKPCVESHTAVSLPKGGRGSTTFDLDVCSRRILVISSSRIRSTASRTTTPSCGVSAPSTIGVEEDDLITSAERICSRYCPNRRTAKAVPGKVFLTGSKETSSHSWRKESDAAAIHPALISPISARRYTPPTEGGPLAAPNT